MHGSATIQSLTRENGPLYETELRMIPDPISGLSSITAHDEAPSVSETRITGGFTLQLLSVLRGLASRDRLELSFTVVNPMGQVQGSLRMTGASNTSLQVATDKAYTATSGRPTHLWQVAIESDDILRVAGRYSIDRLVTLGGGYPIEVDGRVIGALGVSGGHYTDDMRIAVDGLTEVGARVKW